MDDLFSMNGIKIRENGRYRERRGIPDRGYRGTRSLGIALWHGMPPEDKAPVKAANLNMFR